MPVSYTHLDVYKRQAMSIAANGYRRREAGQMQIAVECWQRGIFGGTERENTDRRRYHQESQ